MVTRYRQLTSFTHNDRCSIHTYPEGWADFVYDAFQTTADGASLVHVHPGPFAVKTTLAGGISRSDSTHARATSTVLTGCCRKQSGRYGEHRISIERGHPLDKYHRREALYLLRADPRMVAQCDDLRQRRGHSPLHAHGRPTRGLHQRRDDQPHAHAPRSGYIRCVVSFPNLRDLSTNPLCTQARARRDA